MSTLSDKEKQNYLNQLFEFLELPSISADSRYKKTMEETAEWLSNQLINSGCDSSKIYSTNGHPIVYGEKIIDELNRIKEDKKVRVKGLEPPCC